MRKSHFDYIICGGGASGLLLAFRICNDPFFKNKSILLIEKEHEKLNDRTWCFWESKEGDLEEIIHKSWNQSFFASKDFHLDFNLSPYKYKMIRSLDFYKFIQQHFRKFNQLTQVKDEVIKIESNKVTTLASEYNTDFIFSSILDPKKLLQQKKYPVLQQHFIGQIIETKNNCFDPDRIEFMNFDIPQKGNTRFMYVLPLSKNKALLEYTLFSEDLLARQEYVDEITAFAKDLPTGGFKVVEEEQGNIPMTCFRFDLSNTENILHIGTAGGWTKPSTGYTFQRINSKTKFLVEFLKRTRPLKQFGRKNRFWFYDLLFLDVLHEDNANGADLFKRMFQKNSPEVIFKFLDEKSNYWQEFQIMRSFNVGQFVKALFRRIF
tara:strand:- start:3167 stop:4300 length:1134 start_codon:yes stop_codon:yes gene_type:complete